MQEVIGSTPIFSTEEMKVKEGKTPGQEIGRAFLFLNKFILHLFLKNYRFFVTKFLYFHI